MLLAPWAPGWRDISSGAAPLRDEDLAAPAVTLADSAAVLADALIADIWVDWDVDAASIGFLMVFVEVTR